LTSIIGKRLCLHEQLQQQQQQNEILTASVDRLQKLANLGTATYMIAHELNNLLTPPANYATLALENAQDRQLTDKALRKTALNCTRATAVMESLLKLANGQQQQTQTVRLSGLIDDVFACLCRDFSKDGITVDVQVPDELQLEAVAVQLQQVLMNLILNARDAMLPSGGCLTIKACADSGKTVLIEVTDTGRGIEPAKLDKIFEPFFSTKRDAEPGCHDGRGAGLGLAFCRKVIDGHGGAIRVESAPQKGTTFKITIPKNQGPKPSPSV